MDSIQTKGSMNLLGEYSVQKEISQKSCLQVSIFEYIYCSATDSFSNHTPFLFARYLSFCLSPMKKATAPPLKLLCII